MNSAEAKEFLETTRLSMTELAIILPKSYHTLMSTQRGHDAIRPEEGNKFRIWDAVKIALYFRLTQVGFPARDAKYVVHHFLETKPKPSVEEQADGSFIAVFVDRQHSPQITFFRQGNPAASELLSALLQAGNIATRWNMSQLYKEIAEKVLAWKERRDYVPERSAEAKAMIEAFQRIQKKKLEPSKVRESGPARVRVRSRSRTDATDATNATIPCRPTAARPQR
jgi:hypothetical protein